MASMTAMQHHSGEEPNVSGMSIVPEKLRKENETSYKPKVVSVGPRLRGTRRDLLKMEVTKWQCMSYLLNRVQGNAEINLARCGELILGLEKEVRASYVDDLRQMNWRDMANIMLYDGCFIIYLLNDGHLSSWEELENCLSDLLVLDNQIPFFILRKLHRQLFVGTGDSIETLALNLFGYKIPDTCILSAGTKNASNIIELVHSYISNDLKDGQERNQHIVESREDIKEPAQLDRCATMLRAAGVKINLLDSDVSVQGAFDFRLRFNYISGTLDIPQLFITEATKARWQNLIAWEHHKMETGATSGTFKCICTSAALFFNALICSESDVQLLKDKGIIYDWPDMSNKEQITFFRSIKHGIDSRYNIFDFNDLNTYYRHPIRHGAQIPIRFWHYLTGSPREALRDLHNFLKRGYNYAAALITILSLLQTIYAVLSYHHPRK